MAALYVLFFHARLQVWSGAWQPEAWTRWLTAWLDHGHYAVDVFIVLSGFCLMLPIARGTGRLQSGAWGFYLNRIRRILPPYYAALLLSLLLIATLIGKKTGHHWDICIPVTATGLISNLLLVQNLFGEYQINGVFWSIAVECQIYLLFPVMVWSWRKWGAGWTLTAATLLGYGLAWWAYQASFKAATPHYLSLFVLGMLGADVCFSPRTRYRFLRHSQVLISLAVASAAALAGLTCYWYGTMELVDRLPLLDALVAVATVALLILASRQPQTSRIARMLSVKPLVFAGLFSYSLYLIHFPLLQGVWQLFIAPLRLRSLSTFLMLLLLSPLIIGAAYGFFVCFERPFLSRENLRITVARLRALVNDSGHGQPMAEAKPSSIPPPSEPAP